MELKHSICNELHCTELIIESELTYEEEYQVRMIRENEIPHILNVAVLGRAQGSQYSYDISGMRSLKVACEKSPCNKEYLGEFLEQLLETLMSLNNYMLDINGILLNPEYIFVKDEVFYFAYYPIQRNGISESFHELTEFFVKEIDYTDYPSVILACELHKKTMEESYDLPSLIRQHVIGEADGMAREKGEVKRDFNDERVKLQQEETLWAAEDDEVEEKQNPEFKGYAQAQEEYKGNGAFQKMRNMIRETPVRKYWEQKQKERWGEWDDLLTQEESSIMEHS